MKMIQIVVVFLSLFVMLGGLALPLYWASVAPYLASFPAVAEGIMRSIASFVDILSSIV